MLQLLSYLLFSLACLPWDDPKILVRSGDVPLQVSQLSPDLQVMESKLRIFKKGNLVNPKVYEEAVLVDSVNSTDSIPAIVLNLDTDSKSIDIDVWDEDDSAAVIRLGEKQFALGGLGEVRFLILTVGDDFKIKKKHLLVQFPDPKPNPNPQPDPQPDPTPTPTPGPDDKKLPADFDEIAKRVQGWSKGLSKTKEVANNYRQYAALLRKPQGTINSISEAMVAARNTILGDSAPWKPVLEPMNADLQTRWPLSKGVLADYWECVAAGLDPSGYIPKGPPNKTTVQLINILP
jgi:hypothetical protein